MPPHTRKRARARAQTDNNSVITAESNSSDEPSPQTIPEETAHLLLQNTRSALTGITVTIGQLLSHQQKDEPVALLLKSIAATALAGLVAKLLPSCNIQNSSDFTECAAYIKTAYNSIYPTVTKVDASTSTEPTLIPPKPTYSSVAAQADAPTPSPPVQPQGPSPSPPPIPTQSSPTGSGPPGHSPKPHVSKPRKSARSTGTSPKSPLPDSPKSKSGQQVRLVACIANRPDAATTDHPRFKAFPTDCFADLSRTLKSSAPGCVPLGFRINRKGNIVITFTPTTPRSLLMSNLWIIRGAFELSHNVPILFDTAWSTIHLANVPTRSNESAPVFDQAEIAATLQNNPALAALPITLQPRWLRHPSKITGPRSSVVFSFEDPDGAIARQLLKTPTYMFGSSVTVKPWISNPASTARPLRSVSISHVSAVTNEGSNMDIN